MCFIPFALASLLAVVTTTAFRSELSIEGRRCQTVRIPAVRTAPNGDLVAAFDARRNNINDLGTGKGEEVEIATSRSTDNGLTWSAPRDITAELFRPEWAADRYSFMTSGCGTQLRDGTLLAVINDFTGHRANVFDTSFLGAGTWRTESR